MENLKKNKFKLFFFLLFVLCACLYLVGDIYSFRIFHDQFFKFDLINDNPKIALNFQNYNLDLPSGPEFYVTFFDRIAINLLFIFFNKIALTLNFLFILKVFILFLSNFYIFNKINNKNIKNKKNFNFILITSLFFSLSPFSILYWHGNNFSLNLYFVYILSPYFIFYLREIFCNDEFNYNGYLKNFVIIFILCFFTLPGFYLSIPLYLFLFIYTISFYKKKNFKNFYKKIIVIFLINIPNFIIFFPLYLEYNFYLEFLNASIPNENTYTNIKFGLFSAIAGIITWGHFVDWGDYPLFLFSNVYLNIFPIITFCTIFIMSIFKLDYKIKENRFYLYLIILALFLYKGNSLPFGIIYEKIISYNIFLFLRSPDNKLSLIIYLFLCLTFLGIKNKNNTSFLIFKTILILNISISFFIFLFLTFPSKNMELKKPYLINQDFYEAINYFKDKPSAVISTLPSNTGAGKFSHDFKSHMYSRNSFYLFSSLPYRKIINSDSIEKNNINYIVWYKYNNLNVNDAQILKHIIGNYKIVLENKSFTIFEIIEDKIDAYIFSKKKIINDKLLNIYKINTSNEEINLNKVLKQETWKALSYDCLYCFSSYKFYQFSNFKILAKNNNLIIFNVYGTLIYFIFILNLCLIFLSLIYLFIKQKKFN